MNSFFKSEYFKNIATLLSGSAAAQVILLVISPILTRLFTPADFGIFGLFTAISTILGMVASGRLEIAILLPEKDLEGTRIFQLCLWIALFFSILILLIGVFIAPIDFVRQSTIFKYRYWLAATVFLQAAVQSYTGLLNRFKNYGGITRARLFGSFGIATFSILLGFFKFGAIGLILGKLAGQFIETIGLFFSKKTSENTTNHRSSEVVTERSRSAENSNSKTDVSYKKLFSKYSVFAKFSTIEGLLNNIFKQIPIFALSAFFSETATGHYSFAQKIIGAPSGMLAGSVGKVFYQKAVENNRKNDGSLRLFFKQNMKTLGMIIVPVSIFVIALSPTLFDFVFGDEWRTSGIYAAWLMPFIAVAFVKAPLSCIIDIKNKLKANLLFEIGFLLITIGAFYLAFAENDALLGISIFSLGNAGLGLVQLGWFYSLTKVESGF